MGKYKICVYAICKNEENFVDRWMDSMSEADLVVVTDTGSTDKTVEKLRERGATVYVEEIKPWRFDVARNTSLNHVPDDVDICVCTDLDEIFNVGWRGYLEKAWTPSANMANYLYNWSLKPDGTPDVQFNYFKIHKKKDYIWSYPIHECLKYIGKTMETKVFAKDVILNHYPDNTKSRGSYLPLLELGAEEMPEDDRINYYLGREYMYKGEWEKCIDTLKRYLELKTATWSEERCAAMRWIAKSYFRLQNEPEASRWYFRAIAECPTMREPYIEFAQMEYNYKNWSLIFYLVEEALKIKEKSKVYVNMGYTWNETPYDLGSLSCYYIGLYEKALEYIKIAMEMSPENKRLEDNLKFIEEKLKK